MQILHGVTRAQFDQLWASEQDWFEAPNYRRGGWSGVSKIQLDTAHGEIPVYLKQQFRHSYRSWRQLLRKRPTALREYRNIKRLTAAGIATVDLVLFAVQGDKAILGTRALEAYQSLDQVDLSRLSIEQRRALIRAVASCIRQLHQHRYQHNCLYPKHIFVCQTDDGWSVKLIDLEKMKRRWRSRAAMQHDLDTLNRRSRDLFNQRDRLVFMRAYLGEQFSTSAIQSLLNNRQGRD